MAQDEDDGGRVSTGSSRSRPGVRSSRSGAAAVVPCVVGTGPLGIREVMIETVGEAVLERALEALPVELTEQYRAITPTSWVPLDLSSRVIDAVAIEAGRDPEVFFAEMVRTGSMRSLNAFYRTLLRFAWDEMLVARAAGAYAHIRNVGRLEATLTGPGEAIAVLREWPDLNERVARSLGYTMEAFFLAAGKHSVHVESRLEPPVEPAARPSSATYHCSWRS
jgi:hypothetical protein